MKNCSDCKNDSLCDRCDKLVNQKKKFSANLIEINKKLAIARENGFNFNQINKLTIKIKGNLQCINICYYLKHRIPMCHRLFFRRISQSKEYIENICNDINNPFACRKWYLANQTL